MTVAGLALGAMQMGFLLGLGVIAVVLSRGALAQDDLKVRLGIISPSQRAVEFLHEHTLPELARLGFVVGRNISLEERIGPPDRIPSLARDLVASKPDVVIAVSDLAIRAIFSADPDIPIVMSFIGGDPVAAGYAESLSRPGGRVTGLMMLAGELDAKRLAFLQEATPSAKRIAVLRGMPPRHEANVAQVRSTAESLGLIVQSFPVSGPEDYSAAFDLMRDAQVDALLILPAPEFARDAAVLANAAIEADLPTACEWTFMAREGCLIGYGPSQPELLRRTGAIAAKILGGVQAGEIPIERPVSFGLALNLRTAQILGITMPDSLISQADEVIE
jgi:putative ABC transport system substrate-binding protein